jgi:flagellar motor switch protein FliN/FliY
MPDANPNPTPPNPAPAPSPEVAPSAADMAESALEAAEQAVSSLQTDPVPFEPAAFTKGGGGEPAKGLDLLADVNLNVKIELGRTRMLVEDVLKLGEGAVVELDKLAGDPVDVYVNERHIARGEVLVLNDNFCVRINEIIQNPDADGGQKRRPA